MRDDVMMAFWKDPSERGKIASYFDDGNEPVGVEIARVMDAHGKERGS